MSDETRRPDTQPAPAPAAQARKPWSRPTLTRWGDLADLTRGGGGTKKEQPSSGGAGFTRF